MASTEYVILKSHALPGKDNVSGWVTQGTAKASSAGAAIRAHLNGADEGGEFVAIPLRSWQPVSVEIQKAIRFS